MHGSHGTTAKVRLNEASIEDKRESCAQQRARRISVHRFVVVTRNKCLYSRLFGSFVCTQIVRLRVDSSVDMCHRTHDFDLIHPARWYCSASICTNPSTTISVRTCGNWGGETEGRILRSVRSTHGVDPLCMVAQSLVSRAEY